MATGGIPSDEDIREGDIDGVILNAMPNQEFDEAVNAMHNSIQKDIADSSALVSDKYDILELKNEYAEDDAVYLKKIEILSEKFSHVRKTRGDGNCFYRAFGFGFLEQLLTNKESFANFRSKASETKDNLEKLGYPSFTVEDFHDQFMSVVDSVGAGIPVEELIAIFCDDGLSNYLVVYLRLITSCHLQRNHEFFQHFVDGDLTVEDFCKGVRKCFLDVCVKRFKFRTKCYLFSQEVEPMDRESDHIHIIALTAALDLCIRVAYVDRANSEEIIYHDFPEGKKPQLHLLYRPGHYDVIYPR